MKRALGIALLGLLLAAAPASAATYTVTGTADPGTCNGLACTGVQAALDAAKAAAGADEVDLQATKYTASKGFTISDASGVTVIGAAADQTTLTSSQGVRVLSNSGTATLAHLKVAGANISQGTGGGILNTGSMTLDHVEVSGNQALNGGGIGNQGRLTIRYSLVANNVATGDGGGIFATDGGGTTGVASTLDVHDSTLAFNTSQTRAGGGGIDLRGSLANRVTLERVTVARNIGGNPGLGAGGILISGGTAVLQATATIVSNNTHVAGDAANCGVTRPVDGGFNVENGTDCGFAASTDRQGVDPGLAVSLTDAGGETALLPIPPTSPAVDLGPTCSGVIDQRNIPRPQGSSCDAGAYEYDPPPAVVVDSGPSGVTTDAAPQFAFHSADPGVSFQCRLDGPGGQGTFAPCTSPRSFGALSPGSYTFVLEAVGPGGKTTTTSRSFTVAVPLQGTPTPTATPPPAPVFHKNVVVRRVSGKVLLKLPGTNKFVALNVTQNVKLGSTIDVRHGKIALTSVPKKGGKPQTALFYGGIFKLTQPGGITQLQLNQPLAACPHRHHAAAAAAAKKTKPKTRSLWGDGHGAFRTKGQYSAATVRGTKWFVRDSCAGTLTRVAHGVVAVRDEVRHKTVTLRAGKRYLARPRR